MSEQLYPQSWCTTYNLPDRTAEDEEDVIIHLMECLFHVPDDEAERIKNQFILKYTFLDIARIKHF